MEIHPRPWMMIRWNMMLLLMITGAIGCLPSMSTGPEPHSIEYDVRKFTELADEIRELDGRRPSFKMSMLMHNIGILEYRDHGEIKLFFCGYGVVGKGWGFAYGDFTGSEISDPGSIQRDNEFLGMTYLQKVDDHWYRFGAG